MTNRALKQAITDSGVKQYRLAASAKLTETRLSKIVNGREAATPEEQTRLAKLLKRSKASLFGAPAEAPVEQDS
jgi:plasmid maintenance system antidote protein VapI